MTSMHSTEEELLLLLLPRICIVVAADLAAACEARCALMLVTCPGHAWCVYKACLIGILDRWGRGGKRKSGV